jgi:hypothetical protein
MKCDHYTGSWQVYPPLLPLTPEGRKRLMCEQWMQLAVAHPQATSKPGCQDEQAATNLLAVESTGLL